MGKNYFEMIRDGILVDGSGGGDAPAPVLITKSVTENGVYAASSDNADGYSSVTVEVPSDTPTLITKSVTANGTYSASDDSADGYSTVSVAVPNTYTQADENKVVHNGALTAQTSDTANTNGTVDTTLISSLTVAVPNTYSAGDEGKVVQSGALVSQTATSTTTNGTIDTTTNNSIVVNVANSYVAADEGKVVSNGALVSQGSDSCTTNGTVDTTLISSLLVNVQGGGGGLSQIAKLSTESQRVSSSDLYIAESPDYIYIFGTVNSTSSGSTAFIIPDSFDSSKIGSYFFGASIGSTANMTTMTYTSPNQISISIGSGLYAFHGAFRIKSS